MMVLLLIAVALLAFFLGKKYGERQVLKNEQILLRADETPAVEVVDEELVALVTAAVAGYEAAEQEKAPLGCIDDEQMAICSAAIAEFLRESACIKRR